MYKITVDGETIHMSGTHYRDFIAIAATLNLTINSSGQLSITLPPNNVGVQNGLMKKLKSIVRVFKDNELIWKGRILDSSRDFIGRCTYKCEGMLSVLCDSVVRPQSTKSDTVSYAPDAFFKDLIQKHNTQMSASAKQFSFVVDGISSTKRKFPVGAYENTFDYIQSNFLNNNDIGGIMYLGGNDLKTIYYLSNKRAEETLMSTQNIVFGENLLDLTEYIDASQIYTVLIPIGKDNLTIRKVNNNKDYVEPEESTWINTFGRIYHQETFSDIEKASDLMSKGKRFLKESLSKDNITIDISAFDLSLIDVDAGEIKIGHYTRVISPIHEMDTAYICSGINMDLCNPANSTYTFGQSPESSFTGKQVLSSKKIDAIGKYGATEPTPITDLDIDWDAGKTKYGTEPYTISNESFYYQSGKCYLEFKITFTSGASWQADAYFIYFLIDKVNAPKTAATGTAVQVNATAKYGVIVASYDESDSDGKVSINIGRDGTSGSMSSGAALTCSMSWTPVGGE